MRLKNYRLSSTIAMLITCMERLEIAENPNWQAVASAVAQLELFHAGKQADLDEVSTSLRNVHQQIAAVDRSIALKIDIARILVDSLRIGFIEIDVEVYQNKPVWISIDLAIGPDQTGGADFHA